MSSETSSLLGKAGGNAEEPKNFYFLTKTKSQRGEDAAATAAPATGAATNGIEMTASAVVGASTMPQQQSSSWFGRLFGQQTQSEHGLNKPRTVLVKIEPKVFFANERTFLSWLHMAVTLASISVAIVAFAEANEWSQVYGLLLLPVAIAFCCYALWMYIKRSNMIRRKDPGPYEDRTGPVVLSIMLGLAILMNFVVKLYDYAS